MARADAEIGNILPEGIDKTKEGYKARNPTLAY